MIMETVREKTEILQCNAASVYSVFVRRTLQKHDSRCMKFMGRAKGCSCRNNIRSEEICRELGIYDTNDRIRQSSLIWNSEDERKLPNEMSNQKHSFQVSRCG